MSLAAPLLLPGEGAEPPRGPAPPCGRHRQDTEVASSVPEGLWAGLPGPAGSRPLRTMPRSEAQVTVVSWTRDPGPGCRQGSLGGRAPGGARHGGDRCSLSVSHRPLLLAPGSTRSGAGGCCRRPRGPRPRGARWRHRAGDEPGRGCAHSSARRSRPPHREQGGFGPETRDPGRRHKGAGGAVPRAGPGPHVCASESSSRPPLPRRYLARSFRVTSPTTWLRLSTTTKCRRPSARNSLNTRGSDASCGTV